MKRGVWEKKKFTGTELRGKLLGSRRLRPDRPRSGGPRARVRHGDRRARPVHRRARRGSRRRSARRRSTICWRASDFITLHMPSLPETHHLMNAERLARCKKGVRIVNTARGELIDEAALADAIESGHVAGAGLDVFESEPPTDKRLDVASRRSSRRRTSRRRRTKRRSWSAARSRSTSATTCSKASSGTPSTSRRCRPTTLPKLRPYLLLAEKLGALVAQLAARERPEEIGIRYYGPLMSARKRHRQRGARRRAVAHGRRRDGGERARARRASAASTSSSRAAAGRATSCT